MPIATMLGNVEIVRSFGTATVTPGPNATARNALFGLTPLVNFGQSRSATGVTTIPLLSPSIRLAQTPGFVASPKIISFVASASMGQASANAITQGILSNRQFGMDVSVQGPPQGLQYQNSSLGLATIIAPSGNTVSPIIPSYYFPHIVMGITSTQNGALNIQRYIDTAGTVAQGSVVTAALTGNSAAVVDNVDGKGFGSFQITVTNTGAANATLSGIVLLLLAK